MTPQLKYIFVFLFLGLTGYAQTVRLSGSVVCPQEKLPVEGAVVKADAETWSVTDSSGNFSLQLQAGEYHVEVFKNGYKTEKRKMSLSADSRVVFNLLPDSFVLNTVTIEADKENDFGIGSMNNVEGITINAGKKSEVLLLKDISGNLSANTARQVFSKVAGINIFENDGAGIQLNIGGRGLNPNRVSNFNTRQNGYDISADALGYPESYYTPPTEAVERIEVLRGAASLQYGTQFGGIINFVMREGNPSKKIEVVSRNTAGSFGFFTTYNAVGGQKKKLNYYVFHQYKRGDGWRPNSRFNSNIAYAGLRYSASEKIKLSADYTLMKYIAQQPGGLTDKQFKADPSQSTRSRNWFNVNWNLFSLKADWKISNMTRAQVMGFGLVASRGALGILNQAQYADPYDLYLKGLYSADDPALQRNLLWDDYRNYGFEARLLHRYKLVKENYSVFLVGARYYNGTTYRLQGNANSGTGPDFNFLNENNLENSSFTFPSSNTAVFVENIFQLSKKFSVTPGIRFENIRTGAKGYFKEKYYDLAGNLIYEAKVEDEKDKKRHFILGGIGMLFKQNKSLDIYANISQNYRSINFNDMRVANPNLRVDSNLQDEKGFTADAGIRYSLKNKIYADASVFYMKYEGRIGTILQKNNTRLRTNVSDSRNMGAEIFAEADFLRIFLRKETKHGLSLFTNFSFIDAKYINSRQSNYENNRVELVPEIILRNGITYKYRDLKVTLQTSYVSEQFSDASNAEYTVNAVAGVIPAYFVSDASVQYSYKWFGVNAGINNILNSVYFTRRTDGYPGPGIIPSDPRNFYFTLQFKL